MQEFIMGSCEDCLKLT